MSFSYLNFGEKPLKMILEEKLEKPVYVDNDARIMALGEYAFGLARGKNNVLCVNIGSGIGLGMILNGRLYHGNSGFAGEFGHIKLAEDGPLCICGKKGCLETLASGDALVRFVQMVLAEGNSSLILQLVHNDPEKITPAIVVEAARQGDQCSIDALSQIGENLGKGLASLIHLFNPEAIILGGEVARAKNYLTDPVQNTLNKYTIFQIKNDTVILTSDFGEESALYGALALVMENVFEDIKLPVSTL
jgi:glucokinase-like ROK family protein